MKKIFAHGIIAIAFLLLPFSFVHAVSDSGFLNDTIWYSEKSFVEGDTIEIHTAVWNAEDVSLSAKVEFTDGNTILGSRSVTVPVRTLQDVFITWKVTAGEHTIKATIKNATTTVNGKATAITFADAEQSLPKISIAKKSINGVDDVTKAITDKVDSTLPENVAKPISKGIVSVDTFRINTETKIESLLESVGSRIKTFEAASTTAPEPVKTEEPTKKTDTKTTTKTTTKTEEAKVAGTKESTAVKKPLSGTEKPIAYVELFLLKVASFIGLYFFINVIVFF